MEKKMKSYRILVGITLGRRQFGRLRRRWKNNINIDFRKLGSEDVRDVTGSGSCPREEVGMSRCK
jgi:hypothetical protein